MDFRRFFPKNSVTDKISFPEKVVLAEKIKSFQKIAKLEKVALPDHRIVREQLRKSLLVLKHGLAQETQETKKMLLVYQRYTRGEATEQEVQEANHQFVNVMKSLGLSIVVILPFAPVTLPALVKLGDKVGIDILPDSFRGVAVPEEKSSESVAPAITDKLEK